MQNQTCLLTWAPPTLPAARPDPRFCVHIIETYNKKNRTGNYVYEGIWQEFIKDQSSV